MGSRELREAFEALRRASRAHPAPDAAARRRALAALAALLRENADGIAGAIAADFGGRSRDETLMLELVPTMRGIGHARRHLARWMRDEPRRVDVVFQPARAWVRHEPLGVVGIVSPWNFPLLLALSPLTDALAAGNRAMLKPSEATPRFAALLDTLIARRFPPDQVTVVNGGADVARAFCSLPFDHLVFTGSASTGRQVMRAAADNLTPVTLELGGKSPAIVAPDYPVAKAAASIAFGKFLNAGQTCIAPDYALVPRASAERFAEAVMAAARRSYPSLADGRYTAVMAERHRDRLLDAIEEARAGGARILSHGAPTAGSNGVAPTVVLDPPLDGSLMREEIFGPVLPVVGYPDLGEAISFAAARDRPLALYCFTDEAGTRDRILDGVTSGGVTLNGTLLHFAQNRLPFGGIGQSGTGAYHGHEGFRRLSHARAVHKVGPVNVFQRLGPPWTPLGRRIGRFLSR